MYSVSNEQQSMRAINTDTPSTTKVQGEFSSSFKTKLNTHTFSYLDRNACTKMMNHQDFHF